MKPVFTLFFLIMALILSSCSNQKSFDDLFLSNLEKFKQDQENEDVLNEFRKMAEQNHKFSQYFLGTLALAGKIDIKEGVKWLKKADDSGCTGATGVLGMLYLEGHGVEQSSAIAEQLILKAAKKGDLQSQVLMSGFYKTGTDRIPADKYKAYAWVSLASDQCFSSKFKGIYELHKLGMENRFQGDELNMAKVAANELKEKIGTYEYRYCSQSTPIVPDKQ